MATMTMDAAKAVFRDEDGFELDPANDLDAPEIPVSLLADVMTLDELREAAYRLGAKEIGENGVYRLRRDLAERALLAARQYAERCTAEYRRAAQKEVKAHERALKGMVR